MTVSRVALLLLAVTSFSVFAQTPPDRPDLQGSTPAASTAPAAPQLQLPPVDLMRSGPQKTAAPDAKKTIISNGTPVAAGDVTSGTFGSLQGNGLFTFPSGIGVNGTTPVSTTGIVISGTATRGVDAQISGTATANMGLLGSAQGAGAYNYGGYFSAVNGTSGNLGFVGSAQGTGAYNYGGYLSASNGTAGNIGLAMGANAPPAGANNFAILSQSQAQSSLAGNLGIGTSSPNAQIDLASSTQLSERIRLSGQEYFQPSYTDTQGVSFLLGVNRTGNRQVWIGDSAATAPNTTNQVLRFVFGSSFNAPIIDAISTDGSTLKNLSLVPWGGRIGIGTLTPSSRLQVVSTSNALGDGIRVSGSDYATTGGYVILNKNSGTGTAATLQSGDTASWAPLALNPNGGAVGVGTSTPTAQFQVTGSGYTTMAVGRRTDTPALSGLLALESSSGTWSMQNSSGDLLFYSGGTLATSTGTERLRLPASGGIKFPDGTTQTTAFASGNVSPTVMSPGTFGGSGTYNFPSNVTAVGSIKGNSHLSFMPWVNVAGTTATGYVRLMTPIVATESNMFVLHIYGYRYQGEPQLMDIRCGGYAYSTSGLINNSCTATGTDLPVQITTEPVNSVNMVVVRIGTLNSSWYYPHFSLEYDGWVAHDPATFTWSVVDAVPAGAPVLANMNNVAVSNTNGGSVTVGQTAGDTATRMTVNGAVQINGKLTATQVLGAVYQDVAEWVPAAGKLPAGTVVVLNLEKNNEVQASDHAYDTAVAGVVSEMPGLILGVESPSKAQVATTGRVHVKVDATRHAIKVGDLLVTSDKPGVAMVSEPVDIGGIRLHRPGTLIGKALQPLASGEGEILVLLSLQ